MKTSHIVGGVLVGLGGVDLLLGSSSTPIPVLGDFLTPTLDAVLIIGGVVVWMMF